jgi:hypothetical protein
MPKQKGQEIIYLDKENYKDSVVLYSYAYAQEIYSKNENFKASIDQANEQCSAIPDTYKGAL